MPQACAVDRGAGELSCSRAHSAADDVKSPAACGPRHADIRVDRFSACARRPHSLRRRLRPIGFALEIRQVDWVGIDQREAAMRRRE